MFRKPVFWIVFTLVSLGCAIFAFKYFAKAFPIVTLDLQMDRNAALESARSLAERYNWGPEGFAALMRGIRPVAEAVGRVL